MLSGLLFSFLFYFVCCHRPKHMGYVFQNISITSFGKPLLYWNHIERMRPHPYIHLLTLKLWKTRKALGGKIMSYSFEV